MNEVTAERPEAEEDHPKANAIVPPRSVAGTALTLVVAIMSFLACLSAGAVSLVSDAADAWGAQIAREVTIEIAIIDPVVDDRILRAAAIARAAPGIGSVTVMSSEDAGELLAPWLGRQADLSDLPIPRLIRVAIADPAQVDLAALSQKLEAEIPGAILDDHRVWTDRLVAMARTTVALGLGILVLVLMATILSVVFATRAAMAGNRDVVHVLDVIGAGDSFIAGEFQRHFLLLGLRGGAIGGLAAMLLFLLFGLFVSVGAGTPEADQILALVGAPEVGLSGYLAALGIVLLIAVLTAATSRMTVRRYLALAAES